MPRYMKPRLVLAADLGQQHDYTAVTITEHIGNTPEGWPILALIHTERWRGKDYDFTCDRIVQTAARASRLKKEPIDLWIDHGGVGQMPAQIIRNMCGRQADVYLAMITNGAQPSHGEGPKAKHWSIPRNTLFWDGGACVNNGRLKVADGLEHTDIIAREMEAIQTRRMDAGNIKMEHVVSREAPNDDLVFSLCLGIFGHQRNAAKRKAPIAKPLAAVKASVWSDRYDNVLYGQATQVELPPIQAAQQRALMEQAKANDTQKVKFHTGRF